METKKSIFGKFRGQDIVKYTLINDSQTRISVLNWGGTWQEFVVNENGVERNLIWGLDSIEEYQRVGFCLGQSIGRVAGRIGDAQFKIDGQNYHVDMNEQSHSLHGGKNGFNTLIFAGELSQEADSASITLSKHIKATDDNYPGNLDVQIKFTLNNNNRVSIEFTGDTDSSTLFNPTNHVYWNLTDDRTSLAQQWLQIHSINRLEFDVEKVPTGKKLALQGTAYDFNKAQSMKNALERLKAEDGGLEFDDAYEVTPSMGEPIAILGDTARQRQVEIYSDRNGLIIYTANPFDPQKQALHQYNALATEAQTLPDAVNHEGFGDIILRPKQPVTHTISYQYSVQ